MDEQCHKSCLQNGFKWVKETSKLNQSFVESYNEEIDEGYSLEVDVKYLENLHELHDGLSLLLDRTKTHKFGKVVTNLDDKKEYIIQV